MTTAIYPSWQLQQFIEPYIFKCQKYIFPLILFNVLLFNTDNINIFFNQTNVCIFLPEQNILIFL